jgi:hypothetical protein
MALDKGFFERILQDSKKGVPKDLTGFLPTKRVIAFLRAVEAHLEAVNVLSGRIETEVQIDFRRKSMDFRLLVFFLQAVFRANPSQIEVILNNPLNKELREFIAQCSPENTISQQEISDMQPIFAKYKSEIVQLAWDIKTTYHSFCATSSDETFLQLIQETRRKTVYNNVEKLECFDFTRFYPDQLIPEGSPYPDDVMLKLVLYGKQAMLSSTFALAQEISRPWDLPGYGLDFLIARGLDFYVQYPGKDKIYEFMNGLTEPFLEEIMATHTDQLIREGIADPRQVLMDSTTLYARKDDPDIQQREVKRGSPGLCYKMQILCDLEQTPLLVIRRPGEENDAKGFQRCEPRLLRIKSTVEACGLHIDYFLADAGYFGPDIIDFIQAKLEATFVIDLNPKHSARFAAIKTLFEAYRTQSAAIRRKKKFGKGERRRTTYQLYHIVQALTSELERCEREGTVWEQEVARKILQLGVENYLLIYRRRATIEGLIGNLKEYHGLAGKTNSRLKVKGGEKVGVHCLLIFIAVQLNALTRYRLMKHNIHVNQNLFAVKLSDFLLNYEIENGKNQ